MARRLMLVSLLVLSAGCGYRAGYTVRNDVRTVAVPVFANDTFYRDIEVDLTRNVVAEIEKKTPYRIVDSSAADALLEGRITRYRTVVLQEDSKNNPTETEVVLVVALKLLDRRSGDTLYSGDVRDGDNFSAPAGQTEMQARAALFRRAASRIVETAFEEDW